MQIQIFMISILKLLYNFHHPENPQLDPTYYTQQEHFPHPQGGIEIRFIEIVTT